MLTDNAILNVIAGVGIWIVFAVSITSLAMWIDKYIFKKRYY